MGRGQRPLLVLYRRLQGRPDDGGRIYEEGDHRGLAEFLVEFAAGEEKGAPEAMTLVSLVALDAGSSVLARWLQHANPYLDDRDRALIAAYPAFVERARAANSTVLGQHGRVRIDRYLEHHGYTAADVRTFEKRALRFLERARRCPHAPAILRTLPGFVPVGLWLALEEPASAATAKLGAAAVATAAIAIGFWLWPAAERTANATADIAAAVTIDVGPRMLLGWPDGRWRLVHPDGALDWEAPAGLRLPTFVEGAAAGDLTADGVPELVLYASAPLEAPDLVTGIWIFTRDGAGWRLLARLPAHAGKADPVHCRELRERFARGESLTLALHRARQRCPSRIGGVAVRDGALHVVQLHYGRQYLRTTCSAHGCDELAAVLDVDADITSAAWATVAGAEVLVMGTGCWNRFGSSAYGVLARRPDGELAFTWTGGRTTVVAVDRTRLAILGGTPCEGTFQQAAVAANIDTVTATLHQRALLVAELAPDGALRILDRTQLDACCGEDAALAVLRDGAVPRWLAVAASTGDRDPSWQLRVFDLQAGLERPPLAHPLASRRPALSPVDVDGDGRDELAVALDAHGTAVYAIDGGSLRARRW